MKLLRWAVLPVVASLLLPAFRTAALPVEPDYPCYMRTALGRVVSLVGLCAGKTVVIANPSGLLEPQTARGATQQTVNRGQVLETAREIKDGGSGAWILSGKVQNQTQQPISDVLLTLKIQSGAQTIIQNVSPDQATAMPNGYLSFQTTVTPTDKNHRPDFHVDSVQWTNQDGTSGGNCTYASDRAADGSRCGGRASNER